MQQHFQKYELKYYYIKIKSDLGYLWFNKLIKGQIILHDFNESLQKSLQIPVYYSYLHRIFFSMTFGGFSKLDIIMCLKYSKKNVYSILTG